MRSKSLCLFLIFTLSLFPLQTAEAKTAVNHSLEDAMLMMYTSDAILSGEYEDGEANLPGLLFSPQLEDPDPDLDDKSMAAILQGLKNMRNELDTNCRLLTSRLRSEGKGCEADRVKAICDQKRNEINAEIGKYHDLRGDKRKVGTKVWHFLKRNGRTIWYKIGPVGRTFMRRLGPEVLQAVASGGGLSGGVLKKLLKNVARSIGRDRIKQVVLKGVERMLQGQLDILQAAGVDICDPEAELAAEENGSSSSSGGSGPIPDGTHWECADVAGPVAGLIESRKSMEGVQTNYYEFDHWLIYTASPSVLHYFYSYDWSEDWDYGSQGWVTQTWSGTVEDTAVPLDENGIFTVPLSWNELRTTSLGASTEVPTARNRWGLIPRDNFSTVYICDWGRLEMPTGLETLSAENFRDRCGQGMYYFECSLSGK